MTTAESQSVQPSIGASFDPFSTKISQAPFDVWSKLRHECPVAWSDALGGFFLFTQYNDVRAASVDTGTYSSADGTTVPRHAVRMPPEDVDPPEHRKYRDILNPSFAPPTIAAREPWMRAIAQELLDAIPDRTRFDFITTFATPLPRRIILRIIGVPDDDLPQLTEPMEVLNSAYDDAQRAGAAGAALYGYFGAQLAERRDQPRTDDLYSVLLDATFDDRPLTDLEMQHILILNLLGGTDTSTGAIGGMVLWLADHPEDIARLKAEPALVPAAIEEFLRYTSPVAYMARTLTKDVELQGCPMHAGDKVLLGFGPANRDATRFERPDEVILDRHPNNHLTFGAGPHRCLGSHLVKLEMKIALEELLARYATLEVEDYTKLRYSPGQARNLRALPLLAGPSTP